MDSSFSSRQSRILSSDARKFLEVQRSPPHFWPQCGCGIKAKLKTSWTIENPGRRFYNCARRSCSFWVWVDDDVSKGSKELINFLLEKVCTLFEEVKCVDSGRRSVENDEKKDEELRNLKKLLSELENQEKKSRENNKLMTQRAFLFGIVVGFLLSFSLVVFAKQK